MSDGRGKHIRRSEGHLDFMHALGKRMKQSRIDAGIPQSEFAKLIECPVPTYNRFENHGTVCISLYSFRLACKALGKDVNSMLGRKKKKT